MKLAIIGDRNDAYPTHRAINETLSLLPSDVDAGWVATDSGFDPIDFDAIWLVPGSPYADDEAALAAVGAAIDLDIPFLGTCGGFQYACMELARRSGIRDVVHAELEPEAPAPVIEPLACSLYGSWGAVEPGSGTRVALICGSESFAGFHMCGYGLAEAYIPRLTRAGAAVAARGEAGVEAIELPGKEFFIATSFQPQMEHARRGGLHPLIEALIDSGRARGRGGRLFA